MSLDKITQDSIRPEFVARAYYEKINIRCGQQLNKFCLDDIDTLVSQFPDSVWTGKALLTMSYYYQKNNRVTEAQALLNIVKTEFKSMGKL